MTDWQRLIGQNVGQYRITEHISRGGMADVFLAFDEDLRRQVALKIMLPALAGDQQFVERFRREAQTVARLDHPNIVQVYGIGLTDNGRPYIAMQYLEGGSLSDRIAEATAQRQRIPIDQSLTMIYRMTEALQVAHNAGIVHRDIKPSNIMIRQGGEPVLVDLGIAAVEGGPKLTQTGTLMGTPFYMSPEQAGGKPMDGRSDLYSLGVILYELLAGRRPFEASDPLAVLHQHVYEEATPIQQLRPELAPETVYVVQKCLRKNVEERFQMAADMGMAVFQALQAEGYLARDATPRSGLAGVREDMQSPLPGTVQVPGREATGEPKRRRLWPFVTAGVLALALIIFASSRLLSIAPEPELRATLIPTQTRPVVASLSIAEATEAPDAIAAATSTPQPTATATFVILPTFTPQPTASDTPLPTPTATPEAGPESLVIGQSAGQQSIEAIRIGSGANTIIFIGGLHAGFAPGSVSVAERAATHFSENPEQIPPSATLYIVPNANPDSPYAPGELRGRLNSNNVDLNRNWDCRWVPDAKWRGNTVPGSGGPAAFSEPETRALRDFILDEEPAAVVFWEARASGGLSAPGLCGDSPLVSQPLAQVYGIAAGYRVQDFEGLTNQELNGDGTNWLDQQGIPAIAILLPEYEALDWENSLAGMLAVLDDYGR